MSRPNNIVDDMAIRYAAISRTRMNVGSELLTTGLQLDAWMER